ncbi:MAG: outer-membrane lipoprotein carrier protein LolA [Deltaproteobacteria bacterium]|jgi:outer membrane lipoprotein carrier protein|nr:outer-membrane lipoprotein carrier protein LolA [Deltaproteobacteria bacterium]
MTATDPHKPKWLRLGAILLPAVALALVQCLAVLAGPSPAGAQAKLSRADETLLSSFAQRYKGLTSLKAEYIRSTVTPSSDPVFKSQASQTAVGFLYWKKPYNLRLEQVSPDREDMVVDGKTAWWYIPKEKTAHVYRNLELDSEFFALMSFFDGVDELKKNFTISPLPAAEARGALKGFVLTPTSKEGGGTVVIFCDNVPKLQGFRLGSATGERTDFYFTFISPNATFPPNHFEFVPPKGTEIVEEATE